MSYFNYLKYYKQAYNGIDVEKNQQIVIDSGEAGYIFNFAANIPKANFSELQKAFIRANNNLPYIEEFANHFKDKANIEGLREIVIKFGTKEYIDSFNKKFPKKEYTIEEVSFALLEARNGIDIEKNQNIVINSNIASAILDFAKFVKGCDLERLEDAIIKCGRYIVAFACLVKDANITKLEDAIISTNDPEIIYFFAEQYARHYTNTSKLDIEKLRKAIANVDYEEQYYVAKFNKLFPKKEYTSEDVKKFDELSPTNKILDEEKQQDPKPIQETQSNFTNRLKSNLKEGAYQGLANSVISNLQTLIANYVESSNLKEEQIKAISDLLESEYGFIFLSMIVGAGSQFIEIPNINNDHIQKVADKCIQNSSGKFVEIITESFANVLKNIESPKLRVEQVESNQDDISLDEEEQLQKFLIN